MHFSVMANVYNVYEYLNAYILYSSNTTFSLMYDMFTINTIQIHSFKLRSPGRLLHNTVYLKYTWVS